MNAPEKTAVVAAQYIRNLYAHALVRPYENKTQVEFALSGTRTEEKLPEEGHWRVEIEVTVNGTVGEEGFPVFEAGCALEAIVVLQGLTEEETRDYLERNMAGMLLGNARAYIATATQNTGYGPVTLPPLMNDQLPQFFKSPPEDE